MNNVYIVTLAHNGENSYNMGVFLNRAAADKFIQDEELNECGGTVEVEVWEV